MSGGSEIVPAVLTSAQAAKYLGVGLWTFYDYVAQGLIEVIHLPKRSKDRTKSGPADQPRRRQQFSKRDLDAFIERHTHPLKAATIPATRNALITSKNQIKPGWWKRASH